MATGSRTTVPMRCACWQLGLILPVSGRLRPRPLRSRTLNGCPGGVWLSDGHASSDTYVGGLATVAMSALCAYSHREGAAFILMDHVEGVEMGVGAYFNGDGLPDARPASTGSTSGSSPATSANSPARWARSSPTTAAALFFERTLARIAPLLRAHGHVGYVNLNTIVNERGHLAARVHLPLRLSRLRHPRPVAGARLEHPARRMAITMRRPFRPHARLLDLIVLTAADSLFARGSGGPGRPATPDPRARSEDLHLGEAAAASAALVTAACTAGQSSSPAPAGPSPKRLRGLRGRCEVLIPNIRYRLDIGAELFNGGLGHLLEMELAEINANRSCASQIVS